MRRERPHVDRSLLLFAQSPFALLLAQFFNEGLRSRRGGLGYGAAGNHQEAEGC
jgi:hypothetical protein